MQTIRREINEKMHRLKLNYYDVHTHGDILSIITNDVDTINNAISQNLTAAVTQVTTAIGVLVMMLLISPSLSLIPIIMVPLSLLSAAGVMKASEKHYGEQQGIGSLDKIATMGFSAGAMCMWKKCIMDNLLFRHLTIKNVQKRDLHS